LSKILAQKPKTKIDSKITPHSTQKGSVYLAVTDPFSCSQLFGLECGVCSYKKEDRAADPAGLF